MDNESSTSTADPAPSITSSLILITVLLGVGLLSAGKRQQPNSKSERPVGHSHPADDDQHYISVAELKQVPAAIDEYRTNRKQQNTRDGQRFALEVLGLMLVFMTAGLAAANLWFLREYVKKTQILAATASKQLEITDRPWIAVTVEPMPLKRTEQSVEMSFDLVLNNTGHSPAVSVAVTAGMFDSTQDNGSLRQRQLDFCEISRMDIERSTGGDTVFPSTSLSRRVINVGAPMNIGMLLGCVAYRYGTSNTYHYTRFAHGIYRLDPTRPRQSFEFIIGEQPVHLFPAPFGFNDAT